MDIATENNQEFFKKLSESAVDVIAEAGDPFAGWLFTVILRRINRYSNSLVATFEMLADWTGMSEKSIQRKTQLLEELGILTIVRRQKGNKNAPNEYRLAGVAFDVACQSQSPEQGTQSPLEQTQRPSLTESTEIHHNHDDDEISIFSDSGEFSVESEGLDQRIQEQDAYQPQREYLEQMGVRGHIVHKLKKRPLETLERAFAIARDLAHTNPTGFAVKYLENGAFRSAPSLTSTHAVENPFAGLSWADVS